jgi:hypothetical protein
MVAITSSDLRELQHRYNAAYTAYQSCIIAINEAAMSGKAPSENLRVSEAKSLRDLTDARGKLLAAMNKLNGGHPTYK